MPPELWMGSAAGDGRARDRFALGLVIAEILSPALRGSRDLAREARETKLASPFDAWCGALLSPDPGARPAPRGSRSKRAAHRARRSTRDDSRAASERLTWEVGAPRSARLPALIRARCRWRGLPASGCVHAIEMSRRARALREEPSNAARVELGEADALARARWLVALVGSAAARWSLSGIAEVSDDRCARALITLGESRDPGAWTLVDVETRDLDLDRDLDRDRLDPRPSTLRLRWLWRCRALANEPRSKPSKKATSLPRSSVALAADALRRMGEAGRALALLEGDHDPKVHTLRAEIARRAGDRERALREARAAIDQDPLDDRAHAILARISIDAGSPREALAALADAPRSAATSEARVIALMACGQRQEAEKELALPDALASTEEARGRVAGLIGYVANLSGDDARAISSYTEAVHHAERAEALLEEATYLISLAASAVNQGDIAGALEASRRASLLWEHLGRPDNAARALLARAAAFSTAGAVLEATSLGREARERARALGDRRAEAWACWSLTDVLPAGHADALEPARFAFSTSDASGIEEDRFRALSRLLASRAGRGRRRKRHLGRRARLTRDDLGRCAPRMVESSRGGILARARSGPRRICGAGDLPSGRAPGADRRARSGIRCGGCACRPARRWQRGATALSSPGRSCENLARDGAGRPSRDC